MFAVLPVFVGLQMLLIDFENIRAMTVQESVCERDRPRRS